MISVWRRSPQEVDPLSWFTGPRLPWVFGGVAIAQGLVTTIAYWNGWSNVWLELAAMPFFLAAALFIAISAGPSRPQFSLRSGALALGISSIGFLLAAVGTIGSSVPVQQWWPGIALGSTLASLAPYSSARRMIAYSIPLAVLVSVIGLVVFGSLTHFWPASGIITIAVSPIVAVGVAAVIFCHTVVSRTTAFLETSAGDEDGYAAVTAESDSDQLDTLARLSSRVAPFIERIASAGKITEADRALAAQIARTLRAELVTIAQDSWLDVVARPAGMVVSDPGRVADEMNESQRAALRGLIVAAQSSLAVDQQTLLVELRTQEDGIIAVALSTDVDLPEGRRKVMLAPYYLTLKTTVDDLSWDEGNGLNLKFRLPPSPARSVGYLPE